MLVNNRAHLLLLIAFLFSSCRIDEGIEQEDLLEPHPNGGCPEGAVDPFDNSESPFVGGDVEIKIVMSTATDFRCPYCAKFAGRAAEAFSDPKYKDYVRFYYHHFPLGMHEDALDVHIRSAAVYFQSEEKFWRLHDQIFESAESGNSMSVSEINDWIEAELDLDMDQFDQDVASDDTLNYVLSDKNQASDMGINSVPKVIICGQILYSWDNFEAVLDHYLGY